jgi:DNA-binding NarL/FixJ family response regulator
MKTVQFHLTHIYSKLALSSRAELAARLRDDTNDINGTNGQPA